MLAGGKRWVPGFEFQRNEHYGKRRRTLLPTRHLHRRRPRLQIGRRKNSKIGRRRSEHKTRRAANQDVVRVSIAAEAVAHEFKAVAKRSHAGSQRYLQGGGRRFHRWNNGACDSASAPLRSEEHTSELQSHLNLVCRLLLEKKKNTSQFQSHLNILCRPLIHKNNSRT